MKVDQFRPTRQAATVTRVRPLNVANRDRYERHPTVGGVRLICGGSLCVGESRTIGILARHTQSVAQFTEASPLAIVETRRLPPGLTSELDSLRAETLRSNQ